MPNGAAWSPTFPPPKPPGVFAFTEPAKVPRRHLLLRAKERAVPGDSCHATWNPGKIAYHYFRFWRLDGTWERMHLALRTRVQVRPKRLPHPAAGRADGQSIKPTGVGGKERGYDGAKKRTVKP